MKDGELEAAFRRAPARFLGGALLGVVLGPLLATWNLFANRGGHDLPSGVRLRPNATLPILPHYVAITVGSTIYFRGAPDLASAGGARLLRHELAHVEQFRAFGWWGMCWRYGALLASCGYGQHPMECEARDAEVN
jgi:hypothetical protein